MKNLMNCTCGHQYRDEVYTALRVVTGFAFVYHGYSKVMMGQTAVSKMFADFGIPLPDLMAILVTYGELLGGLALIAGFLTHWVAKMNVVIMLGAIFFVHLPKGYNGMEGGYEYQLLLLAVSVFFVVSGSGKYSVDAHCKKNMKDLPS